MGKLYSALIGLSMIWGTSFLFIKLLLDEMGPAAVVFGRCLFGTLLLGLLFLIQKKRLNTKNIPWLMVLWVALLNNVFPWMLITLSETKISSSLASIINATTPIWTLLIGFFFFSTNLKKNQWFGILIGFAGIFVLSNIRTGDIVTGNTFGVLLMSGATLCYGLASHLTKKHLARLSVMEISFVTLAISTVISFCFVAVTTPESFSAFLRTENILLLTGLGAFGSGVAYLLYYYLVREGSPEFASLVTYLVPASALLWGALLLKEPIHLYMAAGLIIIFTGVYVSSLKSKTKHNLSNSIT